MRGIKSKFDTSKPFKIVTNLQVFQAMQPTDRLFPVHQPHGEQENAHKEEIVVPKIEIVPRLTKRKAFARITPEYIRLPSYLNLPKTDIYELTEVDRLFLSGIRSKYGLDRFNLDKEFLQRVMIELQSKAGREPVLPRSKVWLVNFLQREYKQLLQQPTFQQFATLLYNYWRSRREELKFPIYRPLWRPAENEFNHMLAFKARPKNSRNLRRTNRIDEADIVQELHDEYQNAAMLCERIEAREDIKLRQIQLQILSFAQQCKDFIDMDQELQKVATPDIPRIDQREKVRKLRLATEDFKKRRDNTESYDSQNITREVVNQKQSVASFLANVVYQAEKMGINHDTIFRPFQPSFPSLKHSNSFNQSRPSQELPEPEPNPDEKLQTTCFSLHRYGDLLVRSLSVQSQEFQQGPKDYFSSRHRRISGSYFGEDDNLGEYRDLRRIISANFKRFLQLTTNP